MRYTNPRLYLRSTLLKVVCCRNRQQIGNVQLCCRFWQHIGNNVNLTACCGRLCCRYGGLCCQDGRLCCQCVRGQSNTVDFVAKTVNFVAKTVDFVASVYGAKATQSTLSTSNEVDRVEFNFVAWALDLHKCKSILLVIVVTYLLRLELKSRGVRQLATKKNNVIVLRRRCC